MTDPELMTQDVPPNASKARPPGAGHLDAP